MSWNSQISSKQCEFCHTNYRLIQIDFFHSELEELPILHGHKTLSFLFVNSQICINSVFGDFTSRIAHLFSSKTQVSFAVRKSQHWECNSIYRVYGLNVILCENLQKILNPHSKHIRSLYFSLILPWVKLFTLYVLHDIQTTHTPEQLSTWLIFFLLFFRSEQNNVFAKKWFRKMIRHYIQKRKQVLAIK